MDSIIRSWNDQIIRQRENGFLSATDMCQACDRLFADWYFSIEGATCIESLLLSTEYHAKELVQVEKGLESTYLEAIRNGLNDVWVRVEIFKHLQEWCIGDKLNQSQEVFSLFFNEKVTKTLCSEKKERSRSFNLYVLQAVNTNLCKIGISRNVGKRVKSIQSGFPAETVRLVAEYDIENAYEIEQMVLSHFQANVKQGKWLEVEVSTVTDFIKGLLGS